MRHVCGSTHRCWTADQGWWYSDGVGGSNWYETQDWPTRRGHSGILGGGRGVEGVLLVPSHDWRAWVSCHQMHVVVQRRNRIAFDECTGTGNVGITRYFFEWKPCSVSVVLSGKIPIKLFRWIIHYVKEIISSVFLGIGLFKLFKTGLLKEQNCKNCPDYPFRCTRKFSSWGCHLKPLQTRRVIGEQKVLKWASI